MNQEILHVKLSIQFKGKSTHCWKKGEGTNLYEAIQNLFNKKYNYIKSSQMSAVLKEIMKTKGKLFKRKE